MSDPTEITERRGRILAELSELGLTLARSIHGRAMTAEDDKSASDLGLAFHRISRSVRQTLALEAKLERDQRREAREDREAGEGQPERRLRDQVRIKRRKTDVREALQQVIWDEAEGEESDDLLDLLDDHLEVAARSDDFGLDPLDHHIARLCAEFGFTPGDDGEGAAASAHGLNGQASAPPSIQIPPAEGGFEPPVPPNST
ncbi:MAG: hypothetical protein JWP23_3292 [Phenylobacterium sp.]|nr:hypothetical protein [Phenylobacterium sp.]